MMTPELTCQDVVALVPGELAVLPGPDARTPLEAHLATCPRCDTYLAQMRRTIALLGQAAAGSVDPAVEERLRRTFRDWSRDSQDRDQDQDREEA